MRVVWGILAAIAFVAALPARADDFKVPPKPDHYVTDSAGALSGETRTALEAKLAAYEKATGHQVIVWIGDTTGDVPLETFTTETAHEWHVGRRGHDDGAILFLFMRDHHIRIEVGYGLEGSLTDADSSRIIQNDIRPRMRENDVDGAVSAGVAAILKTITPSYAGVTPPPQTPQASAALSSGIGTFIFAIFALFFGILILTVVMQVIRAIRYGYLVMREGPKKAKQDMRGWWAAGSGAFIGGGSSSFGDSGGFDGGFSAGGGDFGGGGASGSW